MIQRSVDELSLYFMERGTLIEVEANKPLIIEDEQYVWFVLSGQVEVYSVTTEHGEIVDKRAYLFQMEERCVLYGFYEDVNARRTALLAIGTRGTKLLQLPRSQLYQLIQDGLYKEEIAESINDWVNRVSEAIVRVNLPSQSVAIEAGKSHFIEEGTYVRVMRNLLWVTRISGELEWPAHGSKVTLPHDAVFPLSYSSFLQASSDAEITACETYEWLQQDSRLVGLTQYHEGVYRAIRQIGDLVKQFEDLQLQQKVDNDQLFVTKSIDQLKAAMSTSKVNPKVQDGVRGNEALFEACQAIGRYLDIKVQQGRVNEETVSRVDPVLAIAKASRIRTRKVMLTGQWWKEDNGPLLAYLEQDNRPVALIPVNSRSYEQYDPSDGSSKRVTASMTNEFKASAYTFYKSLPTHELTLKDLLKFSSSKTNIRDMIMIVLMGVLGGLLGMLTPIMMGILFDRVIPSANRGQLVQMAMILLGSGLAVLMFEIVRSMAMLRIESKMDNSIEAAIWDRLLSLPVSFFRRFSSGDLALRANSINMIRKQMSGVVITSVFGGIFSIFNLLLLFKYNARMAWIALVLVAISVFVATFFAIWQMRSQKKLAGQQGRLSGFMLQLIGGIAKFRIAGAENRAFYLWSDLFSLQKRSSFHIRTITNYSTVFNSFYPIITSIVLFNVMANSQSTPMSTGTFAAFFIAFTAFLSAMSNMTTALLSIMNIVPTYQRAKPILQAVPEVHTGSEDPGELSGTIEINQLNFRYREDQPYILNHISLQIKSGEFVAIVGSSGSGKSTLLRLLLGFEPAESGAIYYDGHEMGSLDLAMLRSQFGVVLQNGQLMTGDIYSNIIGSSNISMEEAWEAVRMAGLEEDIKGMPMGMYTMVTEGGSTLSGGQRQRLLIARAIVRRPRIMFFDEATSALDNRTQAIVSESLEKLQVTRIVIAHRLSTVMYADRIIVLDQGQIVQSGTYSELMQTEGIFAELAKRQVS